MHLDAGYDSAVTRDLLEGPGRGAVISVEGFPLQARDLLTAVPRATVRPGAVHCDDVASRPPSCDIEV